ncbi:MAG: methyltransferase domain-containing protein [Candidatus Aminicenantes bacterium]|jgi:SAM-dependent methyltransferase
MKNKKEVNDEKAPFSSPPHAFEEHEVEEYERKRYRGIDQRLVHRRETLLLERILERNAPEGGIALDVPCGYGRFSELFRKRGWHLVSCDYSFSMVKRAKGSSVKDPALKLWGVVANAKQRLPFREKTFSILLCMRFWHHVHDPEERKALLGFFSRVTSGWVILSYYQVNTLHRLQRALRRKLKKSPTRIKMIARQDFYEEVREAGFACEKVFPLFWGIHAQHVALLKKIRT